MPGPAPNPHARRRNKRPDWLSLPADGYDGKIPGWPLRNDPSESESELWMSLWRTPQAAAWIEGGFERVVARYVTITCLVEIEPTAALLGEVRQLEDRLGLSPMAMKRLQWEVEVPSENKLAEVIGSDRFANL